MRQTFPKIPAAAAGISAAMGARDWALLIALSVLWGGSFLFQEVALRALPVLTLVSLRVGLAALVLWVVILGTGRRVPRGARIWVAFFGMGLLNNVIPFGLIVWGQTSIGAGLASILNATTPLFAVLVAGLLLADERFAARKLAGVALGFAGVVVMIGPEAAAGLGRDLWAQVAVLCAAISYACASVFGRRFRGMGLDPLVVAAGQVTGSALMLGPVASLVDHPWALPAPGAVPVVAMLGLAVLSTALAYVLYFRILASAGATNLALVTFLIPATAILLGWGLLGEQLTGGELAGMAGIAAGLICIDGRLLRRR